MKFNIKAVQKSALDNGKPVLFTAAGIIGAQKFLDFKTVFPQVDPNKWFMKNEGAIKLGGVLLTLALWQKIPPMIKYILWGVAIQGALKATRQYTTNAQGKAFFDSIGAGEYDNLISQMAEEIKKDAATSVTGLGDEPITDNEYAGVAGPGDAVELLNANSQTSVAGMGLGQDDDDDENERYL